jgi:hypothetical protein
MRRTIPLGLLLIACTSSAGDPATPAEAHDQVAPEVAQPPAPVSTCEQQIAEYLAEREQLNRCEEDSDCSELWPGLCPHGPHYIHRDSDIEAVVTLEREIMASCTIPDCEPPIELGIAQCQEGACVPGRKPEPDRKQRRELRRNGIMHMSCWDYRETWLEADGGATTTTSSMQQGITPLLGIAPASAGVLTLELDWPASCADCRLLISEHNSGMAQLITPTAVRTEATRKGAPVVRERLELPITPGPYWMLGMASTDTDFTIRAELRDSEGKPGRVTRHGVGWQHMCEG